MDDRAMIEDLQRRLSDAEAALQDLKAAQAVSREAIDTYGAIFEAMDEGYLLADVLFDDAGHSVDIACVQANAAATRMVGADLTGKRLREVSPAYEEYWFEIWGRVARTGRGERHERYASPGNIWYDLYVFKPEPRKLESRRVAVLFQDISRRKQAEIASRESEERQAFLLKLGDVVRAETNADAVGATATRMLAEHMGVDRCWISRLSREQGQAWLGPEYHAAGLAPISGESSMADLPASLRRAETGSLVSRDVANDPHLTELDKASLNAMGFGAYLTAVVREGERSDAWVLAVASPAPRDWTTAERAFVEEAAERTWAAVERARAEHAQRENEQRFRAFTAASTSSIYSLSPDWRVMHQLDSRTLANTAEPIEDWVDKCILDEDLPAVRAAIDAAIRTKSLFELEHRVRLADGSIGWVLSRAVPLLGQDGEIKEWFGAGSDATERRKAAEKLRQSEERHRDELERQVQARTGELKASRDLLKATMDSSTDMIQVFEAVRDGTGAIVDFRWLLNNHTAEAYYGDVVGQSLLARNPGVVEVGIFETFKRVVETGEPDQSERHYVHEQFDGWFYQSAVKLGDGVATTTKDISDWKAAQAQILKLQQDIVAAKLFESEARLRAVLQQAPLAVAFIGAAGQILFRNIMFDRLWGRPAHATTAETYSQSYEGYHLDGRPIASQEWPGARALLKGEVVQGEVLEIVQASGHRITCWYAAAPIRDEAGSIMGGVVLFRDISEERRAQDAVAASEARWRGALDIETVGATFWDPSQSYRLTRSNDAFLRMIGRTREDAIGITSEELTAPEFWATSRARVAEAERTGVLAPYEKQVMRPDGSRVWLLCAGRMLKNELFEFILDVDDRHRSDAALRESEERLRQFGEASQDVLWIRDADTLQWQYLTPAFEAIYGMSREKVLSGDNYRSWLDLILPEDEGQATDAMRRVKEGEKVTFDYRIRRPADGAVRWLRNTDFPIRNDSGEVRMIGGIGHDLTELREAELRLQTLLEGIPQLVWRAVDGGMWTWSSPQWSNYTRLTRDESVGYGWLNAFHPNDRDAAMQSWREAVEMGHLEIDGRVYNAAEHKYRWFQTRATPVRDASGTVIEWLGTCTDIDDGRELQERQKVLVAELQHRTRNLMGVVRSMTEKTVRASADLPDFRKRFRDRLDALARVQGLLSRLNEHDRVTFDTLIRTELAAMSGSAEHVSLSGPEGVRLRSSTVQTLAMAMHELATNAVKYGALGQPDGRLEIRWTLEHRGAGDMPWLHIDWRESGVAMPPAGMAAQGTGRGRELIERALPYQLSAKTTYSFAEDGVHCTISLPVSASTAEVEHA